MAVGLAVHCQSPWSLKKLTNGSSLMFIAMRPVQGLGTHLVIEFEVCPLEFIVSSSQSFLRGGVGSLTQGI